jgi:hypothetical protein
MLGCFAGAEEASRLRNSMCATALGTWLLALARGLAPPRHSRRCIEHRQRLVAINIRRPQRFIKSRELGRQFLLKDHTLHPDPGVAKLLAGGFHTGRR